jgi:DNA-binding HxlR family transcriptional regulator
VSQPDFLAAIMLLQEKWTMPIVLSLLQNPLGFNETARRAGPVNATTLAQRLGQLERAGVLVKTVHSTMPPRTSYALTEAGRALAPVLDAIATWAEQYPLQPALDGSTGLIFGSKGQPILPTRGLDKPYINRYMSASEALLQRALSASQADALDRYPQQPRRSA